MSVECSLSKWNWVIERETFASYKFTGVFSDEVPNGLSERMPSRSVDTWTAWLQCAFSCASSAHPIERISSCTPPRYTCMAFPRCAFSGEPWGESSWCRPCCSLDRSSDELVCFSAAWRHSSKQHSPARMDCREPVLEPWCEERLCAPSSVRGDWSWVALGGSDEAA